MNFHWRKLCWLSLFCLWNVTGKAGGSGLNIAVVINQASSNSVALGNYYAEKRHIPPQNILRTLWTGSNTEWTTNQMQTVLLTPLLQMLSDRGLTNQIMYVLLSMDLPYRVTDGSSYNGTTAALFYGFKPDSIVPPGLPTSCSLPDNSSNSYSGSELPFGIVQTNLAGTRPFLAMMLTSSNLSQALSLVDRGVSSDSTFPSQSTVLAHTSDIFRNVRYFSFDNAIFETRVLGNYSLSKMNIDWPIGLSNLLGFETGNYSVVVPPGIFIPGAMVDSLTSYGGDLFEYTAGQTTALEFLNAGASGSYGTVVEPCNYLEKFPSPLTYFYQARGFTIAESYYQSLTNPYQGILIGEPLAAPFADPPVISWPNLPDSAVLRASTNLSVQANPGVLKRPITQVDLFVDGTYWQTITNLPPTAGNILNVSLNGFSTNYTVPAGASLGSIASNLAVKINGAAFFNNTKILATAVGDRLRLESYDSTKSGSQMAVSASATLGTANRLTTFLNATRSTMLDTTAIGIRSAYLTNVPALGDYLGMILIKTNSQTVPVFVTNTVAGTTLAQFSKQLFSFVDSNPNFTGPDGISVEDIAAHEDYAVAFGPDDHAVDFNVQARSAGWAASQVRVAIVGSSRFGITPAGTNRLDQNLPDLRPRNDLFVTAGATNVSIIAPINTLNLADGYHELKAVGYEGSHVRTVGIAARNVIVTNHAWFASLNLSPGGTNLALEASLQANVSASTNNISRIELFSTGGSLGAFSNVSTVVFSTPGTNFGPGLHPLYAIITDTFGHQFRTATQWVRVTGTESSFLLSLSAPPPTLTWPAVAGRAYTILSSSDISLPFQPLATVVPTNDAASWTDTNNPQSSRFYRVRAGN